MKSPISKTKSKILLGLSFHCLVVAAVVNYVNPEFIKNWCPMLKLWHQVLLGNVFSFFVLVLFIVIGEGASMAKKMTGQ